MEKLTIGDLEVLIKQLKKERKIDKRTVVMCKVNDFEYGAVSKDGIKTNLKLFSFSDKSIKFNLVLTPTNGAYAKI